MENNMNKMDLLKKITVANFMVEDLGLYLNTHPNDCVAVDKYNIYVKESNDLKKMYAECCGMIEEHGSTSPCPWIWINDPWPWEYDANFRL